MCNEPDTHAFLDVCGGDAFTKADDKLCYLFDIDDIFVLLVCTFLALKSPGGVYSTSGFCAGGIDWDDLCASSNLKRMFLAHSLTVRS